MTTQTNLPTGVREAIANELYLHRETSNDANLTDRILTALAPFWPTSVPSVPPADEGIALRAALGVSRAVIEQALKGAPEWDGYYSPFRKALADIKALGIEATPPQDKYNGL